MKLEISTPTRTAQFSIAWLELNTPSGNYIIQQGHAPTLLVLSEGQDINFRLDNGKQESLRVARGIAHIMRDQVVLVIQESNTAS
jgi:F0F1-type ATP synthase epsilon subunit